MVDYTKTAIILTDAKWKALKNKCFLRDNYTCQECGAQYPVEYLDAHHIIPRGRCRIDTLDNLVTLCRGLHTLNCHDSIKGKEIDRLIDKYRDRVQEYLDQLKIVRE